MTVRAVIDTNIWVSAILNPHGFPARIRKYFEHGTFQVIVSESILEEIADVLNRPRIKVKYGIRDSDIHELLILIEERSEHVILLGNVNICRDKDDNAIIETAITGMAEYLVTRDDDIKFDREVVSFLAKHSISVISISKFLDAIEKS